MVTVIIPALNEEKTIRKVIRHARQSECVSEIIVVDDQSTDNTIAEALKEHAIIISSSSIGKGSSMQEGMMKAKNELIVFLDADIPNYANNIIESLTLPLINDEADFIKSYFDRQGGRVTEILVRPLLEYFFPQLVQFKQPLSGMIAGKKSFFEKVEFENDYGVDIGLLIDMHHVNARIMEVCIGEIENDMQPLLALGRMAKQVANAIFKRADLFGLNTRHHKKSAYFSTTAAAIHSVKELALTKPWKIAVFDMDNTLLQGSFIHTAAEKFGFKKDLEKICKSAKTPYIRTKKIAKLLEGRSRNELVSVVDSIPLISDAAYVIRELKSRGYICGIISDSYHCITNHVKNITGMDFALGNELEFKKNIATGEVTIPSGFFNDEHSQCEHEHCKSNMFLELLNQFGVSLNNSLAIGDGENDLCMIRLAGTGVGLNPTYSLLHEVSDHVVYDRSLKPVLEIAK